MSRRYVRKTELMDKERGDALTLRKEDVAALYEPSFPAETRRIILDALIGWFAGAELSPIGDTIANAYLQMLVGRQKKSVSRYLEYCKVRVENRAQQEKAKGAQVPTPDTPTQDTPKTTNQDENGVTGVDTSRDVSGCDGNIIISKSKVKEISKGKDISFTVGKDVMRGQEPRTPLSPTVEEPEESVVHPHIRTIDMIAPPIDSKHYSAEELDVYNDLKEMGDLDDTESIITYTLQTIYETDNPITKNALKKYAADIGDDMLKRAAYRFDCDLTSECIKHSIKEMPPPKEAFPEDALNASPGRHFMARLARLKKALSQLHGQSS